MQFLSFVLDNLYSFCQNKTKLLLNPYGMRRVVAALKETIYFGISRSEVVPAANDKNNIFRPFLFVLFPNLVEIELWTSYEGCYPLNPVSLLSVLVESDIPSSFRELKIWDTEQEWMKEAFDGSDGVKEQYLAQDWTFRTETVPTWQEEDEEEDWLYIQRKSCLE